MDALRIGALGVLLAASACSRSEPGHEPPAKTAAPTPATPAKAAKDPAAARKLIGEGALVLDVRTPDEYREGHVPTSTNIPVTEVPDRLADIEKLVAGDKSKPIVVYCAAGGRAAKAKRALEEAGFKNVVNGGGYDDLR
jgi:rhodanese-related sulfurtransferase